MHIFDHIHKQSLSFFNVMPTGTLMSRIINDVSLLQQAVSNALVGSVRDFFQVVILLGVVFYMNWRLAMVSFIVLPIAAYPIVKFGKLFRRLSTRTQEEVAGVSNILHETITGSRIVKAFSRESYEGERFQRQVGKLFSLTLKDAKYRCLQHPLMEFIGGAAIAMIIWFGGKEVIAGTATPGTFFAFLTALIAAFGPQIDYVIRTLDDFHVVLYDNDRIPHVNQGVETIHQFGDVIEMESGGGLIEDEKRAGTASLGNVGCKFQSLCLAPGERGRRLPQPQVSQAGIRQYPQSFLQCGKRVEE
jgi:ABC-type multidrug transport system fused ATPase/permease subunit